MFKKMSRVALTIATMVLGGLGLDVSHAQGFPEKTITIVAPFPPGGAVDAIARVLAEDLGARLNQAVVVENATGAGGIIGAGRVAKARPDGYTLLFNNMSQATVNIFNSNVPYDALKDFSSIGSVAYIPMMVFTRSGFVEGDAQDVLSKIKSKSADVFVATNGVGSTTYLCQAQFQKSLGIFGLTEVPYKGSGQALVDLAGGKVDVACDTMLGAGAFAQAGRIVPVAVASTERLKSFPNVPTFKELGYEDMEVLLWVGLFAPKDLPASISGVLSEALQQTVQDARVKERLAQMSAEVESKEAATPAALDKRMRDEAARWTALAKR